MRRALSEPIEVTDAPAASARRPSGVGQRRTARRVVSSVLVESESAAALFERFCRGDERALEAVFAELSQPLVAFAHSFVRDYDDAQDVVQRAVIRVWDGRGQLPADVSLRACLFQVTRCEAENLRRPIRRRSQMLGQLLNFFSAVAPRRPDDTAHQRLLLDRIDREVQRFPPAVREAFWLKRVVGLSYSEIGHVQGVAPETARAQVKDGHRRLRRRIVDTSV